MHDRTHRNTAQRQAVARLDRGLGAGQDFRARRHTLGGDDVAAFAVGINHEGNVRAAIRIVLQALHAARNAVLVAPEIDEAIVALVTAALMARTDTAQIVASAAAVFLLEQRRVRRALVQVGASHPDHGADTRGSWLALDQCHCLNSLLLPDEIDVLARLQAHIGLLPVLPAAGVTSAPGFFPGEVFMPASPRASSPRPGS